MTSYEFIVNEEAVGNRIDLFLVKELSELSRSYIKKIVVGGNVLVNEKSTKVNYKLRLNDKVIVNIPEDVEPDILAENIDLDIVYDDQDFVIINKPKDMVVHPAPGNYTGTIVNGIMYHFKDDLSGINGVLRPGIVHRIDKNTTGLLVICKNDKAHVHIAEQLKNHTITRKYEAIVYHNLKEEEGVVDKPIGRHPVNRKQMAVNYKNGKEARTHYKVIERLKNNRFNHIELQLETGRTHQIRVHMASINHPLLGDDVYGPKKSPYNLEGQVLHARSLGFIHPRTNEYMEFTSELPEYFSSLITKLR